MQRGIRTTVGSPGSRPGGTPSRARVVLGEGVGLGGRLPMLRGVLVLLALVAGHAGVCRASLTFTLSRNTTGIIDLEIVASGIANATGDMYLIVGDSRDSFLRDGAPLVTGDPGPDVSIGGFRFINSFYLDENNGQHGLQSLLGFNFGDSSSGCGHEPGSIFCLNGPVDLSVLSGSYVLPGTAFDDFIPGTYVGLTPGSREHDLQGLGNITLIVIPEPSISVLIALGLAVFSIRVGERRG